jgi:hypothetical protein
LRSLVWLRSDGTRSTKEPLADSPFREPPFVPRAYAFSDLPALCQVRIDLEAVFQDVSQRGVHGAKSERRVLLQDLFRRLAGIEVTMKRGDGISLAHLRVMECLHRALLAVAVVLAATSHPRTLHAEGAAHPDPALPSRPDDGRPRRVFLEIRGATEGVQVMRQSQTGPNQAVCTGRCQEELDPGPVYLLRTTRALIPSSRRFVLPDDRSRVVLQVTPRSSLRPIAGWTLFGAGFLGVLVSTAMLLNGPPSGGGHQASSLLWALGYPAGIGVAGFGVYLLASSGPGVTSDSGSEITTTESSPAAGESMPRRREKRGVRLTAYGLAF